MFPFLFETRGYHCTNDFVCIFSISVLMISPEFVAVYFIQVNLVMVGRNDMMIWLWPVQTRTAEGCSSITRRGLGRAALQRR
jgi:hypothetical protein